MPFFQTHPLGIASHLAAKQGAFDNSGFGSQSLVHLHLVHGLSGSTGTKSFSLYTTPLNTQVRSASNAVKITLFITNHLTCMYSFKRFKFYIRHS